MIDSLGAGQDNVVFLGRRSFRMELAGRSEDDDRVIPRRASEVPTEKIFHADRDRAARDMLAALRSRRGLSRASSIALCATTFGLGIALTLTFSRRPEPPRPSVAPPPTPAPAIVIERVPAAPPVVTEPLVPPAVLPARRPPLARPARAVRPRPVRAVSSTPPAPAVRPWVDPFAE